MTAATVALRGTRGAGPLSRRPFVAALSRFASPPCTQRSQLTCCPQNRTQSPERCDDGMGARALARCSFPSTSALWLCTGLQRQICGGAASGAGLGHAGMCNIPPRLAGPPSPWTPPYLMAVFTQVDLSSSDWFIEAAGQRRSAWEVVAPAATRVALPVARAGQNQL